ncbi:MAG: 4Fe-4S binding protein [Clostridia bacterium]|nr:4Fe-4S binding protein [Clostridia bacterium]
MKKWRSLLSRLKERPLRQAIRRKALQMAAFGFTNADLGNFARGVINKGPWKKFCAPGMNCYSCPAARFACPIGALQAVGGSMNFRFSFYVVGFLLAVGVLIGRLVCGFLCPFGLLQELLHKIPTKKFHLWKPLRYVKYVFLAVMVFLLPVMATDFLGMGDPWYCRLICPVGTLEGGIPLLAANESLQRLAGPLFWWKIFLLAVTVVFSVLICRFFCKVGCPLGAFYGLLNRFSAYHLEVDDDKCIRCGRCERECPMEIDPTKTPNSPECIRCGHCRAICPAEAICFRFGYGGKGNKIKKEP